MASEDTRERVARAICQRTPEEWHSWRFTMEGKRALRTATRVLAVVSPSPVDAEQDAIRVWIDRQHYDFKKRLTTGAKLRKAASVPDDMALWREGRTPTEEDVEVPDDQGFALFRDDRFYSSPKLISGSAPTGGRHEAPRA